MRPIFSFSLYVGMMTIALLTKTLIKNKTNEKGKIGQLGKCPLWGNLGLIILINDFLR